MPKSLNELQRDVNKLTEENQHSNAQHKYYFEMFQNVSKKNSELELELRELRQMHINRVDADIATAKEHASANAG